MENRTFAIGDIHGALKALKQLLERIDPRQDDKFIFLGDCVDGWSESAQVISFLIEFAKRHSCIFVKGNHDAWCEGWLKQHETSVDWLTSGGAATIASYAELTASEKDAHIHFFEHMKDYYVDDQNRLFVHAGFSAVRGPEHERYKSNFYWDRTLWEMALAMDKQLSKTSKFYPRRLLHFFEIYIGHTPTSRYDSDKPILAANVWNVDTGAAFTGPISAINIDSKQIFQSDPVNLLYPLEKGRN